MSARFLCPNDGEVMNIEQLPGTATSSGMTEQYRCPFCRYSKDKTTVISTHKLVDETYIAPSRVPAKKK